MTRLWLLEGNRRGLVAVSRCIVHWEEELVCVCEIINNYVIMTIIRPYYRRRG